MASSQKNWTVITRKKADTISVKRAAQHFEETRKTALIVGNTTVEGIFTEHDILKLVAEKKVLLPQASAKS